jgi:hypothetical protein
VLTIRNPVIYFTHLQAVAENPNFIKLRKLEAIRSIANSIAHSKNKVILSSSSLLLDELSEGYGQ